MKAVLKAVLKAALSDGPTKRVPCLCIWARADSARQTSRLKMR